MMVKGADDQWIQYAKLAKAYKGGYIDLSVNPNPITAFGDVDDYVFMDTNWQDVLFGNAGSTQHNPKRFRRKMINLCIVCQWDICMMIVH